MALTCFRYLGFTSFAQVDQLTVPEYQLLVQAIRLRQVDDACRIHLQAFQNFRVQAMKKVGKNKQKPMFTSFRQFFDYEEALDRARGKGKNNRFAGIGSILKKGGR